jgi:hypothetical protein
MPGARTKRLTLIARIMGSAVVFLVAPWSTSPASIRGTRYD